MHAMSAGALQCGVGQGHAASYLCRAWAASSSSFPSPIMVCAELLRMTAVRARIAATATAMSVPLASASWNSRSAISFSVPVDTDAQNEFALAPAVCQLTGLRYAASAQVCPTHADRRRRRLCLPWRRSPIAQVDPQVHSEHGAVLCSVDKSCELVWGASELTELSDACGRTMHATIS